MLWLAVTTSVRYRSEIVHYSMRSYNYMFLYLTCEYKPIIYLKLSILLNKLRTEINRKPNLYLPTFLLPERAEELKLENLKIWSEIIHVQLIIIKSGLELLVAHTNTSKHKHNITTHITPEPNNNCQLITSITFNLNK
jgi:hypothetical protein